MIYLASGLKECFQKSLARQHRRSHCKVEIGCYWWCWDAMTGIFYNLMSQLHQEAASYLGDFESNHYHQNFDRYKKLYIANQRHQKWTHSVSNADKSWGGFSLKFLRSPPWISNDLRWCRYFLFTNHFFYVIYIHTHPILSVPAILMIKVALQILDPIFKGISPPTFENSWITNICTGCFFHWASP